VRAQNKSNGKKFDKNSNWSLSATLNNQNWFVDEALYKPSL